jgi:bla regulator protein BlaR1
MTTRFIINHLWQSSCFVLLAGLLAFVLRRNSPKVRYWVWLSASLKFLAPFAFLVSLGSVFPHPARHAVSVAAPVFPNTLVQIAEPFSPTFGATVPAHAPLHWVPVAIGVVWAFGFLAITLARCRSWFRIRAVLRASTPLELPIPVPAFASSGSEEPVVVGFLRPALVVPAQLLEHLNPRQLDAVLAHELCHVRRRDNLFAAAHMIVEAIFWFHPLVWWIGSRLLQERELACDEEVLRLGCEPVDYVRGILTVCQFCLEMPAACVSGVTGADVKKRVRAILTGKVAPALNLSRRLVLALAGAATVLVPVGIGLIEAPATRAQTAPQTISQSADVQTIAEKFEGATAGFEVASIKRDVSGEPVTYARWFPSLHIERMTLKNLIILVYQVQDFEVTGGPGWINSERYNIDAKTEAPAVPSQQYVALERRGLQTLLRDRFHLAIHRETKQLPIYELTVAKGGLKVHPSDCIQRVTGDTAIAPGKTGSDYCRSPANGGGRIQGSGVSMAFLSHILANRLSRTVADKTGITGEFDLQLTFTPDTPTVPSPDAVRPGRADGAAAADPGPDIFTALQEQLGLKLESAKGPVEILVIDQVEKPDAN